jgi:TctA family transporter
MRNVATHPAGFALLSPPYESHKNYRKIVTPFLQSIAFKFGSAEYLALIACVLLVIGLFTSRTVIHALGAIAVGALLAMIGVDVNSGMTRFTGGDEILADGISAWVVLIAFVLLPRVLVAHAPRTRLAIYLQSRLTESQLSFANALWRGALLMVIAVMLPLDEIFVSPQIMLGILLILSIIDVWFYRVEIPSVVLYFGFAYGAMIEENMRRALLLSRGDVLVNLQRPIVLGLIAFICLTLLLRFALMKRRRTP